MSPGVLNGRHPFPLVVAEAIGCCIGKFVEADLPIWGLVVVDLFPITVRLHLNAEGVAVLGAELLVHVPPHVARCTHLVLAPISFHHA